MSESLPLRNTGFCTYYPHSQKTFPVTPVRPPEGAKSGTLAITDRKIQWEHRLASAASAHTLELVQPDMTTGIAAIEGEQYIRGNYGVYRIEYNNDIQSYVVKTGDGLDYPVTYNKNTFAWETKIVNFKPHRLTSSNFKRLDNHLKKSMIKQELKRRNQSNRLRYPVRAGEVTYNDGGENFMPSMKASNLGEAWNNHENDDKPGRQSYCRPTSPGCPSNIVYH